MLNNYKITLELFQNIMNLEKEENRAILIKNEKIFYVEENFENNYKTEEIVIITINDFYCYCKEWILNFNLFVDSSNEKNNCSATLFNLKRIPRFSCKSKNEKQAIFDVCQWFLEHGPQIEEESDAPLYTIMSSDEIF